MKVRNLNSSKLRLNFLAFIVVFFCFGGLILRLAYLQIVKHGEYKRKVEKQYTTITRLKPKRGSIYDRNMNMLAKSASVWNVVVAPKSFESDEKKHNAAADLAEILGLDAKVIEEQMKKPSYYEVLKRQVEDLVANKIRAYKREHGSCPVYLEPSTKRYYLRCDFLANVLGFIGNDGVGLEGIEAYYDDELRGSDGKVIGTTNAWGTDMPDSNQQVMNAKNGDSLVLTIDANIQEIVERNLEMAVLEHSVENRAVGIVMDVNTGEILAMSTKPDYDPNKPFEVFDEKRQKELEEIKDPSEKSAKHLEFLQEQWRNKPVSDTIEPGSIFKIITAAGALEEGAVQPGDTFDCSGSTVVDDRRIHCWRTEGHVSLDFESALVHSCNPAFIKMGLKLGQERFTKYFEAFGFNELTGIDLPGEASSIFHSPEKFRNHALAVSSIGQSFKATPIQWITGVAAAVNGGKLVKPHIVRQIIDENKNVVKSFDTIVKRQVISKKVSQIVAKGCEKVVSEAGGRQAYRKGYRTGGKTGTAEQLDRQVDGVVTNYTLSFLAFTPVDSPQLAIVVLLDTPRVDELWGSVIAVPVVGRILDGLYKYMNIESTYTDSEIAEAICVPDVVGLSVSEAKLKLKDYGLRYNLSGEKEEVITQLPAAGFYVPKRSVITLHTDSTQEVEEVVVPDVVGKGLIEAKEILSNCRLNYTIQNEYGNESSEERKVVTKQTPKDGEKVNPGAIVTLEFVYSADANVG